jgi:VWFA-related protein
VPDAPSAKQPPAAEFPPNAPKAPAKQERSPEPPAEQTDQNQTSPPPEVRSVPRGRATGGQGSGQDELFTVVINPTFVLVPVTVKNPSGVMVEGLTARDFSVYEDGVEQKVNFFTSDPIALSAAVVIDTSLPQVEMKRVVESLPALVGAFSQYDQVALYFYGNTIEQRLTFGAAEERLARELRRAKPKGKAPMMAGPGPLNSGPTINGRPAEPSAPSIYNRPPEQESSVLNDAIQRAALDLARLPRNRRKIIFVISSGREEGSRASYSDVLKALLSNEISLYAVAVGGSAIPGYGDLNEIRVPGLSYGNILPKYASATGGEVFPEFSRSAIERTYARVTEVARNQYTLGYNARATAASNYRSIEVRVHRSGLRVFAKDGYFPLPPARNAEKPEEQPQSR